MGIGEKGSGVNQVYARASQLRDVGKGGKGQWQCDIESQDSRGRVVSTNRNTIQMLVNTQDAFVLPDTGRHRRGAKSAPTQA